MFLSHMPIRRGPGRPFVRRLSDEYVAGNSLRHPRNSTLHRRMCDRRFFYEWGGRFSPPGLRLQEHVYLRWIGGRRKSRRQPESYDHGAGRTRDDVQLSRCRDNLERFGVFGLGRICAGGHRQHAVEHRLLTTHPEATGVEQSTALKCHPICCQQGRTERLPLAEPALRKMTRNGGGPCRCQTLQYHRVFHPT